MVAKLRLNDFFCRGYFKPFLSKNVQIWDHFFPLLFPQGFLISRIFGHPTLGSWGKMMFIQNLKSEQMKKKKIVKNFFRRGNFRPVLSKNVKIWDQFSKDFESLVYLYILLWKVGAKRCLNGTSKVKTRTAGQTSLLRRMHGRPFRIQLHQ